MSDATGQESPLLKGLADLLGSGCGHALLSACPGAGKTHTLGQIAQRHSDFEILALVFNRHNAHELRERLPQGCEVRTLHSLAVGLLYKGGLRYTPCASVNASCYLEMRELLEASLATRLSSTALRGMLRELAARYDAYLLSAVAFESASQESASPESGCEVPVVGPLGNPLENVAPVPDYAALLPMLLERRTRAVGQQRGKEGGQGEFKLAFTETLHYACRQLEESAKRGAARGVGAGGGTGSARSRLILLDELQDSSKLALRLVTLSLGPQGRLIAVGDPRQNIMGFAGAAPDPYGLLEALLREGEGGKAGKAENKSKNGRSNKTNKSNKTNGKDGAAPTEPLPWVSHFGLEQSRRVPYRHAALANYVFSRHGVARYSDFVGTDCQGHLHQAELVELPRLLSEGDRVLSRTALPLVHLALEMLEARFSLQGERGQGKSPAACASPRLRLGGGVAELRRLLDEVFTLFDSSTSGEFARIHSPLERMQLAITGVTRPRGVTPSVTGVHLVTPVHPAPPSAVSALSPSTDPGGPLELAKALFEGLLDLVSDPADSHRVKVFLRAALEDLLSPAQGVLLSTVHGAKGSEAQRVFVLGPGVLPRTAFDPGEEERLRFVAFTRSLETLVLVSLEGEDLTSLLPPGLAFDPFPAPKVWPTARPTPSRTTPLPISLFSQRAALREHGGGSALRAEARNSPEVSRPVRLVTPAFIPLASMPAPSGLRQGSLQKAYFEARNGLEASISELAVLQDTLATLATQGQERGSGDFIARHLEHRRTVLRAQQEKYRQKCALFERELERARVG